MMQVVGIAMKRNTQATTRRKHLRHRWPTSDGCDSWAPEHLEQPPCISASRYVLWPLLFRFILVFGKVKCGRAPPFVVTQQLVPVHVPACHCSNSATRRQKSITKRE